MRGHDALAHMLGEEDVRARNAPLIESTSMPSVPLTSVWHPGILCFMYRQAGVPGVNLVLWRPEFVPPFPLVYLHVIHFFRYRAHTTHVLMSHMAHF